MEVMMADAYGVFIFAKSDDCVMDTQALADAMNEFAWDSSNGKWLADSDNQRIFYGSHLPQYPTVFPERITEFECYCDETDTTYLKSPKDMTDEDWENEVNVCREEAELPVIKETLAAHVSRGWIEIACVSNERARYVTFSSIRINANDKATRRYVFAGTEVGSELTEEAA
jgi:hypothetical protein